MAAFDTLHDKLTTKTMKITLLENHAYMVHSYYYWFITILRHNELCMTLTDKAKSILVDAIVG